MDLPVEKWYRDAKLYKVFEGTSEVQRLVIGRTLSEMNDGPLHHHAPTSGRALVRTVGRRPAGAGGLAPGALASGAASPRRRVAASPRRREDHLAPG